MRIAESSIYDNIVKLNAKTHSEPFEESGPQTLERQHRHRDAGGGSLECCATMVELPGSRFSPASNKDRRKSDAFMVYTRANYGCSAGTMNCT